MFKDKGANHVEYFGDKGQGIYIYVDSENKSKIEEYAKKVIRKKGEVSHD